MKPLRVAIVAEHASAKFGGEAALPRHYFPAALGWAIGSLLKAAVLLAWLGHGRSIVSLRELLAAPLYAVAELPIYLRLLTRRQTEWLRTKRDDPAP